MYYPGSFVYARQPTAYKQISWRSLYCCRTFEPDPKINVQYLKYYLFTIKRDASAELKESDDNILNQNLISDFVSLFVKLKIKSSHLFNPIYYVVITYLPFV